MRILYALLILIPVLLSGYALMHRIGLHIAKRGGRAPQTPPPQYERWQNPASRLEKNDQL